MGSHPHLVRYHTAWIEKDAAAAGDHLYIQLEACDTSLGNLRALKSQAREAELLEILRQVAGLSLLGTCMQAMYVCLLILHQSLAGHAFADRRLGLQITLALQHMHSRHMVHMDIKPDNIYFVDETTYKLGDLGLATSSSSNRHCNIEEGDGR